MCRMAAFISLKPLKGYEVEDFLDALAQMASMGRSLRDRGMGHPHGWGLAAFSKGRPILYVRETFPLWRRSFYARFRADSVLVHARAASVGEVSFENTHPFSAVVGGRVWFFAHNGSVKGMEDGGALGKTDSEAMMLKLVREGIDPPRLVERVREIRERFWEGLSSMTFLLVSGDEIYALKGAKERPDYFNLYVKRDKEIVVLASEPLDDGSWEEMGNWTLLRLERVEGGIREYRYVV